MLASACKLTVPGSVSWEVVVVDNGSRDETPDVVGSFAGRLPIRRVEEHRPGISFARNRGAAEAQGRFLCWTDDDVLLDADWLTAYLEAFARHPEAGVFGGRIIPELVPPVRRWFDRCRHDWPLAGAYASRDLGDEPCPLSTEGGRIPWGANMALRAEAQRRHSYDEQLGASPCLHRLGEETLHIYRLMKEGVAGWWVPDSRVHHMIERPRQTLGHLYDHFGRCGETAAYLHHHFPGDNPDQISEDIEVRAALESSALRWNALRSGIVAAASLLMRDPERLFRHVASAAYDLGILTYRRTEPSFRPRERPMETADA